MLSRWRKKRWIACAQPLCSAGDALRLCLVAKLLIAVEVAIRKLIANSCCVK
jgi:hypothetical protein